VKSPRSPSCSQSKDEGGEDHSKIPIRKKRRGEKRLTKTLYCCNAHAHTPPRGETTPHSPNPAFCTNDETIRTKRSTNAYKGILRGPKQWRSRMRQPEIEEIDTHYERALTEHRDFISPNKRERRSREEEGRTNWVVVKGDSRKEGSAVDRNTKRTPRKPASHNTRRPQPPHAAHGNRPDTENHGFSKKKK